MNGVEAALRARGNPERAAFTAHYFPTSMEILGVSTPEMRAVLAPCRKLPPAEMIALCRTLIAGGTHEGRQAAYDLLDRSARARALLGADEIETLGRGMDNWASVDAYACGLAGRAWNAGQLDEARVLRWARSPDRWWRRAALVSTVPLNMKSRGGRGDPGRTLPACEALAGDPDDMVAKALSWALRALLPHAAGEVLALVARPEVAARVRREVLNKHRTGLKLPAREA